MSGSRTFTFHSCLGRGGFGEVYRATLRAPGGVVQDVAVKLLRSDLTMKQDAVRRLRDEGRLLARLCHPAIPKMIDLVQLDGRIALVTEFIDGRDLADALHCAHPPGLRALLQALAQVASGLDAALTTVGPAGVPLQLVHRDVKLDNIRLGRHGDAKLLDFGIAWSASSKREAHTNTGLVVGSLAWMAPERFGASRCSSAADVFAIGAVLYTALTGQLLYSHTSMPKMAQIATDRLRYEHHISVQLQRIGVRAPSGVRALLAEMIGFEPHARVSIGQVAARLDALAEDVPGLTLRRWARAHAWPEVSEQDGDLVGRVVVANTLTHARAQGFERRRSTDAEESSGLSAGLARGEGCNKRPRSHATPQPLPCGGAAQSPLLGFVAEAGDIAPLAADRSLELLPYGAQLGSLPSPLPALLERHHTLGLPSAVATLLNAECASEPWSLDFEEESVPSSPPPTAVTMVAGAMVVAWVLLCGAALGATVAGVAVVVGF